MALINFLLIYDLRARQLISEQPYRNADEAAVAYAKAEEAHRGDRDVEIVLVGADSLETVKQTHSHYFDGVATVSRYLAGV
jgi:hypothetical protein